MSGYKSITGKLPTDSNVDVWGSSYYIGDNMLLTAGHNIYYFNEEDALSQRSIDALSGYTESTLNLRDYHQEFVSYVGNLSDPLPTNNDTDGEVKTNIRLYDTIFLEKSGSVDSDDAGVIVFLDTADIVSSDFGLASTSDTITVSRKGYTTDASDGALSFLTPGGFLVHDTDAGPGDSGGALVANFDGSILGIGARSFIIGNIHSIQVTSGTGLNARGPSRANYFDKGEFDDIMQFLSQNQQGDVTNSEPTNLIVGTDSNDSSIIGSYRSDIILGRDGDDVISDGDSNTSTAWADDRLVGGNGNDTFYAGKGNDSISGGEYGLNAGAASPTRSTRGCGAAGS